MRPAISRAAARGAGGIQARVREPVRKLKKTFRGMRRSGIAQEQMRKTAQTFSRCSALASARARRLALHRGGDDDAVVASACLRMLLTGTSRKRDRMRRVCARHRVRQPRACSPRPTRSTALARHDEHIRPDERDAAGRRWPQRSEHCRDRQTPRPRRPTAMHITVTAKKPTRGSPRPGAAAAASPSATWRPRRAHRCVRRGRHPRPGVPHPPPASNPIAAMSATQRDADRPIGKPPHYRKRAPLPAAAFFCAAQTKTGRTRRPVRLSRSGARLSGRLPRAARRSRPGSAVRSTAPDRRSPARRSSLRRRRPR